MRRERNDDLHESPTTLRQNLAITPGGNRPKAVELRFRGPRGSEEIVGACQRFITLIERVAKQLEPTAIQTREGA